MEIVGEDDSEVLRLSLGNKVVFGRGSGFNTEDGTVSRHHVVFELKDTPDKREPRVSFEVIGQNPVWVRSKDGGIRVFRKNSKGEFEMGDGFCLSGKIPTWFNFKKSEGHGVAEERLMQVGNEVDESFRDMTVLQDVDVSGIDSVKEFGFVVMGHEFDRYPRHMIRSAKDWDWFLEERKKNSDDEEEYERKKRNVKGKRRKGQDNEDEEWTGESEEDMQVDAKGKKIRQSQELKYNTRSKDSDGITKGRGSSNSKQLRAAVSKDVEDEEDVTLGGFIVEDDEEGVDKEELDEDEDEEEEEEEFEEEEDDDEMEGMK